MSEFVSACIKKNLELLTIYNFVICLGVEQHVYVVFMYMNHILGLMVPCAAVTDLLHGSSVIVFCCHSGEL